MAPRTPLLHPESYFSERGFSIAPAAGAVGVAVAALVVAFVGFGVVLSNRLSSAGHGDAAAAVWDTIGAYVIGIAVAMLIGWLVVAAVLHLFARAVVGHDGRFEQTLAVVGWATAPTVLTSFVAFAFLAAAVGDASMASPSAFTDQFSANLAASALVRHTVAFLVAGWEAYIYANGLQVAFDDRSGGAWLVALVVAYGSWLLTLI